MIYLFEGKPGQGCSLFGGQSGAAMLPALTEAASTVVGVAGGVLVAASVLSDLAEVADTAADVVDSVAQVLL